MNDRPAAEVDPARLDEVHAAVSAIGDMVYVYDASCRFAFANQALLDMFEATYDEVIGRHLRDYVHDNDLATRLESQIKHVIQTGESIVDEAQFIDPDGRLGTYEYVFRLYVEGCQRRVVGATRDITARKHLEAEVSSNNRKLTDILESITDAFYALDANWLFTYVNQRACDVLQRPREQILGFSIWEIFPEVHGTILESTYRSAMRDKQPATFEFYYKPIDTWFQVNAHPSPSVLSVYFRDITEEVRNRREIRSSERRYRTLANSMLQLVWLTDADGKHLYYNDRWYEYTGLTAEESFGFGFANALHPDDVDRTMKRWERSWRDGEGYEIEYRFYSREKDEYRWFLGRAAPVLDDSGQVVEWVGTCTDIQPLKEVERRLAESEERLANAQRLAQIGNWEVDLTTRAFTCSREHRRIHGVDPDDETFSVSTLIESIHPEDRPVVRAESQRVMQHGGAYDVEYRITRPDGEERILYTVAETTADEAGRPIKLSGTVHDITDRKLTQRELLAYAESQTRLLAVLSNLNDTLEQQVEERTEELRQLSMNLERIVEERTAELEASRADLAHRVRHDLLTGLPNRESFEERLNIALRNAKRDGSSVGVLFIDLDGFKLANDSMGHSAGDRILIAIAERLRHELPHSGTIARHSGDEFVAMLESIDSNDSVMTVARSLLSAIERPIYIDGRTVRLSASIGVAMYPEHALDFSGLLRRADLAMYGAKASGKNDVRIYVASMGDEAEDRLQISMHLGGALDRDELYLQFQPQLDLRSGKVLSLEALLRWNNPVLGQVAPARMIPIAEESGLIISIGAWVLNESCRQAARWSELTGEPIRVAVNLSGAQLDRDDFVKLVTRCLGDHNILPEQLELELTERSVMLDTDLAKQRMQALRDLGVRIAMDDFGLGSSSLSNLVHLPLDTVKIDRAFTREIPGHAPSDRVIQAVIALADAIDLDVVVEGVENEAQRERVTQLGCRRLQGYLIGHPADPVDIDAVLLQQTGINPASEKE